MRRGDLALVRPGELPVQNGRLAAHVDALGAVRAGEDERRDEVVGAAELEPVQAPDGEVGALAGLERAEVSAAEDVGAAASPEPESLAHGQRLRPAASTRDEQRLLHVRDQIAALVGRRAVDTEPDRDARIDHRPDGRHAGAEPQVGGRAVRDSGPRRPERPDVLVEEMDAVRAPDVAGQPAELLQVLHGPAAEKALAVLLLLDGLRQVRVQPQAEPPRERRRLRHQPLRDGEGRAGRDRDLRPRPGPSSWSAKRPSVSASTASMSSTRSSGGRPPADSPTSIDPRDATIRTPSSRAAWISASTRPARPGGKT